MVMLSDLRPILLAIAGTLPVSPYITTFSFVIYVVCRLIGERRGRVEKARLTASARSLDDGSTQAAHVGPA